MFILFLYLYIINSVPLVKAKMLYTNKELELVHNETPVCLFFLVVALKKYFLICMWKADGRKSIAQKDFLFI